MSLNFVKVGFHDEVSGFWAFKVQMPYEKYQPTPILVRFIPCKLLTTDCQDNKKTFPYLSSSFFHMQYGVCFYNKEKDWQIAQKIILHTYIDMKNQ